MKECKEEQEMNDIPRVSANRHKSDVYQRLRVTLSIDRRQGSLIVSTLEQSRELRIESPSFSQDRLNYSRMPQLQ